MRISKAPNELSHRYAGLSLVRISLYAALRPGGLGDPAHGVAVYVSVASFWEIAIKRRLGKVAYDGSARAAAADAGFQELAIDAADAETAGALDWSHRDPFDRMLVAQCLNRGLTLVTADARLRARGDIAVMWAGQA